MVPALAPQKSRLTDLLFTLSLTISHAGYQLSLWNCSVIVCSLVLGAILLATISVSASRGSIGSGLSLSRVAAVAGVSGLSRGTVAGLLREACLSSDLVAVLVLGHVTGLGTVKAGADLFLRDTVSVVPFDVDPVVA